MSQFDGKTGEDFVDYYDDVRGFVREQITRQNILEAIQTDAVRSAVDIGGGDGRDSIWLAQQGIETLCVDPSQDMIDRGESSSKALKLGRLLTFERAEAADMPTLLRGNKFDLVLSHGVLMYCTNGLEREAHLELLRSLAAGVVSILTKGYLGAQQSVIERGDFTSSRNLQRNGIFTNNLGERARAFKPQQLEMLLQGHGLDVLSWSGVRIASDADHRSIEVLDDAELTRVLDLERELGKDPNAKGAAQMLHFICKPSAR